MRAVAIQSSYTDVKHANRGVTIIGLGLPIYLLHFFLKLLIIKSISCVMDNCLMRLKNCGSNVNNEQL